MAQRQLSTEERRAAVERAQEEYRKRARALALLLLGGGLSLALWTMQMKAEIRQLHLLVAILAGGNLDADFALRALVERNINRQLFYFNRWVTQLALQTLTADQIDAIVRRAWLYGAAVGETYSGALAHALGVPMLPFHPKDRTLCHVSCRCSWRIVQLEGSGNYDCFWIRGVAEHCPTCNARARAANPLKVRNGRIVNPERYQDARLYA